VEELKKDGNLCDAWAPKIEREEEPKEEIKIEVV